MPLRITRWNGDKIIARPQRILKDFGPVLAEETKKQISTVQFDWPVGTLRFTSLFMGGSANGAIGALSPPTTKAGARNTKSFKTKTQSKKVQGRGVYIPKGLRDVVDTGELLRSQTAPKITADGGLSVLTIGWTAPYAGLVLRGGDYGSYVNVRGEVVTPGQRPGRDWITPALEALPFLDFFTVRWAQLAQGRGGA